MTPPPKDKFTDLPPRIAGLMRGYEKQLKAHGAVIAALAAGLVGLATHCLTH